MKWGLILGASGDIGISIANDMAKKGWSLYLHYSKNKNKIIKLYDQLTEKYPQQEFILIQADMTQVDQIDNILNNIFSLDAIVFAQGTTQYEFFSALDPKEFDKMLTMQLRFPLFLLQKLEGKLSKSRQGRIIFIGSVYGDYGSAMEVGYSTIKGALSAFVHAYCKEVATMGITVNVIAPGAVDTEMNAMFSDEVKSEIREEIPMGYLASSSQISYWVGCLLDENASYLTGQTIYVTGGWLR
ncbi:3-oxoacyl-[acyl-carrier protein] reductase in cluster with unspecified monosaccharide transporter [Ligilactobacillus hayakitensis DSM 18933 = JCM 14209]|uniref:3-oxoacyl-[acyl-carrier protein] reductase in cluster with unspecified monosaccharide transporter n=1 Tax=Ligilactobacillus hayakitensis DSM 18933 = JCM 14209 TaxID=1423755 RepID=A0A0R1WTG8_9LACO|nr:SDR family NAD(P)-dependent oxidoreductase [Ligilactobacillus hayakitensis]KRM19131.1 3-oxoacyl-[acyl-carrier protein] reductase in cluster with unspecified monosaccharide transporter [Ligilactobacillus hayakitensis DSM 18933 = JCM 14209]